MKVYAVSHGKALGFYSVAEMQKPPCNRMAAYYPLKKGFQLFLLFGRDEQGIHGLTRGKVHGLHQGTNAFDTFFLASFLAPILKSFFTPVFTSFFFVVPESDHIDYLLVMGVNEFGQDTASIAVVHGLADGSIQWHMFLLVVGFHLVDKETVVVKKRAFFEDRAIWVVSDVEHGDRELHAAGWGQKGLR